MNYYSLEDAKEIMNTFTSWIGKKAHVGDGTTEVLKAIEIKESSRVVKALAPQKKYMINFRFEGRKKFAAAEFLRVNGLERLILALPSNKDNRTHAA
jgi:hypothetical protein